MADVKDRRGGKARARAKAAPAAKDAATVQDVPRANGEASPATMLARETTARAAAAEAAPTRVKPSATPADVGRTTVEDRDRLATEAMGAGALAVLFALGDAMEGDQRLQKVVHAAKLFLIAVLFIAPVLLMWQHAF